MTIINKTGFSNLTIILIVLTIVAIISLIIKLKRYKFNNNDILKGGGEVDTTALEAKIKDMKYGNPNLDYFTDTDYLYDKDKCLCFERKDGILVGLFLFCIIMLRLGYNLLYRFRQVTLMPIKRQIVI